MSARTVNDIFDKVYLINLDRRSDRLETCNTVLQEHNFVVERISAVDGDTLGVDEINKDFLTYISEDHLRGQLGCVMSHHKVLKDAKEKGYGSILILEDDFKLVSNFEELFEEFYPQVPDDWELLYLGGNHHFHRGVTLKMVTPNVGIPVKTYTTHAYAVRESLYDKLIEVFDKDTNNCPADIGLCHVQKEIKTCYTLWPSLISQEVGFSDITHRVEDYTFFLETKGRYW
tara:strand:- start:660 stop:1349 length:690 start_codon:yes stop_codon:yes gene_type:complete